MLRLELDEADAVEVGASTIASGERKVIDLDADEDEDTSEDGKADEDGDSEEGIADSGDIDLS